MDYEKINCYCWYPDDWQKEDCNNNNNQRPVKMQKECCYEDEYNGKINYNLYGINDEDYFTCNENIRGCYGQFKNFNYYNDNENQKNSCHKPRCNRGNSHGCCFCKLFKICK